MYIYFKYYIVNFKIRKIKNIKEFLKQFKFDSP